MEKEPLPLAELIADANKRYKGRILFEGVDTLASRMYYRLLVSLDRAVKSGLVDITLYLTQVDFEFLCFGMGIDSDEAREKQMQLTHEMPLLVPDDEPPFSLFAGYGVDGRDTPFPVMTDEEFVDWLNPRES